MTALPWAARAQMLVRSFAIQGSWNYETLIGTGFAYALLPALRLLYGPRGKELDRAVHRHLELFNSHPYLATVAVGAVAKLEADHTDANVLRRFKAALRGSLGSMGDRLFWSTWRPMSVLLAVVLLLGGAVWWVAVAAFLLIYNLMHLAVRLFGLRLGIGAGLDVGRLLRGVPLQGIIERSSQLACALVGLAIVLSAGTVIGDPIAAVCTAAAIVFGFWLGIRTREAMIALIAGVAAIALFFGLIGYGA